MIETILFDLDDTLVAEMEWARGGWALVARELAAPLGREAAELERAMARFFERDRAHVFDQLELDAALLERSIALYRTTPRALAILDDAAEALAFAASRRTGIVTDGPRATQRTKVACAGLAARVEVVVYTDELGPGAGKPSPAGFRAALRALGTRAGTAIYVADNAGKDFVGPRSLGMRTVQVSRADGVHRDRAAPRAGEPDVVVDSLRELERVVRSWDRSVE